MIVWRSRVVIPVKLRQVVLSMLHESHAEIVSMQEVSRSYVWWPGLDEEIEHNKKQLTVPGS